MSADAPVGVLSDSLFGGQSFGARAAVLARAERALYRRLLAGLIDGGARLHRTPFLMQQ